MDLIKKNTFRNPITKKSAADPFITYSDGYYYCLFTMGDKLVLHRSSAFGELLDQDKKTIYSAGNEVKACIWAPEMLHFNNKWYIYSSGATEGSDFDSIRMFCLESVTEEPFGDYIFKAFTDPELYAIDQSLYYDTAADKLYIAYAGVTPHFGNAVVIAEMDNPWTISNKREMISTAEYPWELRKARVNEGPFFLKYKEKLFILYSANDTASPDYCIGLLEYNGGSMTDKKSWKKHEDPVFQSDSKTCSVGHCSVFLSPDECEHWLAYHGRTSPDSPYRQLYCQKFTFDGRGYPVFGSPLADIDLDIPSGE
ncbi:MAG: glycoside hydrolase family 43 protein [Eubacteriales bacterium]